MRKVRLFIVPAAALAIALAGCGKTDTSNSTGSSGDAEISASTDSGSSASIDVSTNGASASASARTPDADNTGINKRDRAEDALTPGDQANNEPDRELTRKIRRALTANDQLSMTAKNIKIIAAEGKVTLRGPVKTAAEREQVAALAQQTLAGAGVLDNQLEIKQTAEQKD
jgi:osmotically-inducible protein OsmY